MKKLLFSLGLTLIIGTDLYAQDCQTFLYMTSNAQIQMTIYDKKGQASGVQTWKVTDVKKEGGGFTSSINTSFKDEKGREITQSTGIYKCVNGMLQADIRMSMPQEQMQQYKPTEATMNNVYLEYPYSMSVGQTLKDADFTMDMNMNTGMTANVSFKETNRKVDAKENVTTPAGSWDAYLISYEANMRTKMAGIGIPFTFHVKEWFVPGTGIVKSESYSKNGKLVGSTMITSITK
jgi:hypothetical protein